MANYIATTEQFTATANAIRAKTGNSGSLEWDASTGYADDIAAISTGTDTSDATATSSDILSGKTAYVKGSKVTGTLTNRRVPEAYQEVEYLQSDDWGRAIDIGYIPQFLLGDTFWVEFCLINSSSTNIVFSAHAQKFADDTAMLQFPFSRNGTDDYVAAVQMADINQTANPIKPESWVVYHLDASGIIHFLNKSVAINSAIPGNVTNTLCLFSQDGINGRAKMRLKTVKYTGSSNFELVPCYRKSDLKPGLYDIINNTFLTNTGTQEFSVGPDVT
jgi:hypothetical protein